VGGRAPGRADGDTLPRTPPPAQVCRQVRRVQAARYAQGHLPAVLTRDVGWTVQIGAFSMSE
jgi:hypothetical protein